MELLILKSVEKLNGMWPALATHILFKKSDKRAIRAAVFDDGCYYSTDRKTTLDVSAYGQYEVLCDRKTFELYKQDTLTQAIKLAEELQKARDEIMELRNLLSHYKKKI
jgi:hypothetical protein